jgi:hypothetical protein
MKDYCVQWETRKLGSIGQFYAGAVYDVSAETKQQAIELARKQVSDDIETRAVYCWEKETIDN